MSDLNSDDRVGSDATKGRPTPEANTVLCALDERLEKLRAQGIISGGEGAKGSLLPIARVPGALARFLERRG